MADISQYPVNVSLGSALAQGVLWEERRQGYWKHLDLQAGRTWESVLLCKVEFLYLPSGVGVVEELNST